MWKRKAESISSEIPPPPSWTRAGTDEFKTAGEHAELLQDYIMYLYACGTISAKDVCILSYYIMKSGSRGDWSKMAVPPEQSTGNYQKKLDRIWQRRDDLPAHM
eukprot:6538411-Pyramimonas_sp.AAC.1